VKHPLRSVPRRLGGTRSAATPPAVCDDLAAWSATWPGAARVVLDPATRAERPLPRAVGAEVDPSFADLISFPVPERALVSVPRGRLYGAPRSRVTLTVLPDGSFVGETVALTPAGRHSMLASEPASLRPAPPTEHHDGDHYAMLGFGVGHYYHWGHDLVMGARGIADHLPPGTRLIVPTGLRPFQEEMLSLLGLERHPQVAFPDGASWELERLHVVTPRLKTQIDTPDAFRWFRDAAFARFGASRTPTPEPPARRLLLSRRHDGHWRTVNEAEVEAVLAPLGFETVAPGRLTFAEQIARFADADVVIGTGAGLFNTVFSPAGCRILQFQEPRHIVHALWTAATACHHDYRYLLCESVSNPEAGDADLRVPIDSLLEALAEMGLTT